MLIYRVDYFAYIYTSEWWQTRNALTSDLKVKLSTYQRIDGVDGHKCQRKANTNDYVRHYTSNKMNVFQKISMVCAGAAVVR